MNQNIQNEDKIFYATSSANMPAGAGYYEIHASSMLEARKKVHDYTDNHWCFMYFRLNDVHPMDRKLIAKI